MPQISGGPILLNRADPINRGRLRFWPLREGGNKWAEDVGPWHRHGALGASPTQGLLAIGKSRVFGAANNYINVGQASDLDPLQLPLTITAWIKQTTSGGYRTIFGQYSDYATPGGIGKLLRTDLGVLTYYTTSASGNYQSSSGGPSVAVDTLTFVAIVIEGTVAAPTWRLMANSTIVSGSFAALRSAGPLTNPSYIGNSGRNIAVGPSEEFKGHIALPSIWNRALTNTELRRLLREPDAGALRPSRRIWYTAQVSAGTTYNETISDAATAAESLTAALSAAVAQSEAGTGADSLGSALASVASISDSATAAESVVAALAVVALVSDGATAAEAVAAVLAAAASTSDAATAADAVSLGSVYDETTSDAATAADSLAVGLQILAALSDSGALAESLAAVLAAAGASSDAATAADSLAAVLAAAATTSGSVTGADLMALAGTAVLADPPASRTYTVRPRRTTRQVTARATDRVVAPRSTDRTIT